MGLASFFDVDGGATTTQELVPNSEQVSTTEPGQSRVVLLRTDTPWMCVMTKGVSFTFKHCCWFSDHVETFFVGKWLLQCLHTTAVLLEFEVFSF